MSFYLFVVFSLLVLYKCVILAEHHIQSHCMDSR